MAIPESQTLDKWPPLAQNSLQATAKALFCITLSPRKVRVMAKVMYGGGVSGMSGKQAGLVFARNKGGSYVRQWVKPTNPNSTDQQAARSKVNSLSKSWGTLTSAQQAAWNAWAASNPVLDRLGNVIYLSGVNAYIKINVNRQIVGDATAASTTPGAPTFVENIIDQSQASGLAISGPSVSLPLGSGAAADQIVAVYAGPPQSAGISNAKAVLRLIEVITIDSTIITNDFLTLATSYPAKYGSLTGVLGKRTWFWVYQYSEGQFGTPQKQTGIWAAS